VPADTPACVLSELRVQNLLLIERAELELAEGLNVITGETGAGKTVLAHALDLLLGGRARQGIVRPGAAEAYVEGTFAPSPELMRELRGAEGGELLTPAFGGGAQEAEQVVLARRVGADGRTRAYLNGRSIPVADLRGIGAKLISFYGQHEHRRLTLAAAQLEILDGYCGVVQAERRAACAAAYEELRQLRARLVQARELEGMRERELDLLEHELAEIDDAAPREGELERLRAERERLRALDALLGAAGAASAALAGGDDSTGADTPDAAALSADAAAHLGAIAGADPGLDALAARAQALALEVEDLAGELRGYGERLAEEAADSEAHGLQALEARLAALERLTRKHGGTIEAVREHAERARERREQLRGAGAAARELSTRVRDAEAVFDQRVAALHAARADAAPRLAAAVREQLAALAMPDAAFAVALAPREPGPTGGDAAELEIAPNPGVPAAPLREIASGGELSRVMLALTVVCESAAAGERPTRGRGTRAAGGRGAAAADNRRGEPRAGAGAGESTGATLVFDEVDAGIGGHTARVVGERLRQLAGTRQVLCITHLPQIAALGARHFTVVKEAAGETTSTRVQTLGEPEVVSELVRMLGAPDRDASARRHARELRKAA
jgi:DNA repair protein RecN (Recombination protein N)